MRLVDEQTPAASKVRKTKKQRRRDAKRASNEVKLNDSFGSEDASIFLNDGELMDHVSDNYVSYVHEQMEDGPQQEEELETDAPKAKKKRPEKKPKGKKYKTVIEVEADEIDGLEDDSMGTQSSINSNSTSLTESNNEVILIRRPKSGKNKSPRRDVDALRQINKVTTMKAKQFSPAILPSPRPNNKVVTPNNTVESSSKKIGSAKTPLLCTPVSSKLKGKTLNMTPSSIGSGYKKRVSFVLAKNKEHGK